MSPMRIIILVGAGVAAIGAAFLMRGLSTPQVVTQTVTDTTTVVEAREISETKVLVARRDFLVGDVLSEDDFEWAPWPEKSLVAEYRTEEKSPNAVEELTGSVVKLPIYDREPIHPSKLVLKGETGIMAALVEPGMRALALEISEETASGGFILPNDRVDVILTHEVKVEIGESITDMPASTTLIQNVRVLAIDQVYTQEEEGESSQIGNTATLEVNAKEAELVALALKMGEISLSLRPWSDVNASIPRRPRLDLLTNPGALQEGDAGVTIFRNGKPEGS
jgi:pilus assembly protein CpaB